MTDDKSKKWADGLRELLQDEGYLADITIEDEWDLDFNDEDYNPPTEEYDFPTYVREWDGTICEETTGIPAETYKSISLPDKFSDSL